jgi:hypothetical protein
MRTFAFIFPFVLASQLFAKPVEFMGLKIEAKSIVFVCDGSRWTEDKDDELIFELRHAIDAMDSDRHMSVVFFADEKVVAFNDSKPVPASDANKQKLRVWLQDIKFAGNSTPLPGLVAALQAKPEAVVFVSSGEFKDFDRIESEIDALNKDRRIHLHTVGYFRSEKDDDSRSFVEFMKRLAERNSGTSVVAYADELRRKR